jgi:hypothetical protein
LWLVKCAACATRVCGRRHAPLAIAVRHHKHRSRRLLRTARRHTTPRRTERRAPQRAGRTRGRGAAAGAAPAGCGGRVCEAPLPGAWRVVCCVLRVACCVACGVLCEACAHCFYRRPCRRLAWRAWHRCSLQPPCTASVSGCVQDDTRSWRVHAPKPACMTQRTTPHTSRAPGRMRG